MPKKLRGVVVAANLAYAVVLFVLGLSPDVPGFARGVPDHAAHFTATAVHTALLFILLRGWTGDRGACLLAAVGATLYGGFVELLQLTQPTRKVEAVDLVANAMGACATALVMAIATRGRGKGPDR